MEARIDKVQASETNKKRRPRHFFFGNLSERSLSRSSARPEAFFWGEAAGPRRRRMCSRWMTFCCSSRSFLADGEGDPSEGARERLTSPPVGRAAGEGICTPQSRKWLEVSKTKDMDID